MRLVLPILLLLLLAVASSTGSAYTPMCPSNHIWNNGCVKLCTHPDFNSCGTFFPALYNPSFCALDRSGKWKSETYACFACQRPGVIGVKDGRCTCDV